MVVTLFSVKKLLNEYHNCKKLTKMHRISLNCTAEAQVFQTKDFFQVPPPPYLLRPNKMCLLKC